MSSGGGTRTPLGAPSITAGPTNQLVTAGQTASFSVAAIGTAPLSYQWKKNGTAISGATAAIYTTPATTASDNGASFSVVVSNAAGSAISNSASLTVSAGNVAPSISTQPANQTVTVGQTASFSVAATGTAPLSYQWMKNGTAISGATSSGYTTPATTTSDNGASFSASVRNSVGSATSSQATLTVTASTGAPVISGVIASGIQSTSVAISWTTNVPTDAQVDYGTSAGYGQTSALNSSLATSHSVSLSGLSASTLYHYRVHSKDASGNLATSGDFTFTTAGSQPPQSGASLASLAASMAPRSWATLNTNNISVLAQGSITGNILPFGFKGVWDPTSRRAYYLGGDHGCVNNLSRQVYYDDATNSWVDQGLTSFQACHGYDHLSINNSSETLYFWPYDSSFSSRLSFSKYSVAAGGPWTSVGPFTLKGITNVAHGTDWFDGPITGVGAQGALMLYNCGNPGGEIALYSPEANSLVLDTTGFGGTSTYHCFAAYSKLLNVGVFGGGNANPNSLWRLNHDKTVTALPNSPIALGVQRGIVIADPITGKFIVLGGGSLYEFDPTGSGTWTQLASPPPNTVGNPTIPEDVIGIPIPSYGVIMYATCRATNCRVDIYKHSAGPSGPVPTTISSVSATGITANSATISWTTSAPADSQVEYGTTASYGQSSSLTSSLVTNHSVTLSGLAAGTLYHYRVKSHDSSGNLVTSGDFTFVTSTGGSTTPPTVSITSPASGATVSGTTTLTASATSSTGIASVYFQVDSTMIGSMLTASPYSISWDTTTVSNGTHTVTAVARDTSGNQTPSVGVSIDVANGSAPASLADYQARCNSPGVVRCVGFDTPSDLNGTWGDNSGILSGATTPQVDTTVKASGNSSLKFTIPPQAGADTSGSYFTNFSSDLLTQFGENMDFYIQWRQRFSPEFLTNNYLNGEGWKQSIIGTGDIPGCNSGSTSSACSTSCSALEVVTLNNNQHGFAQMYNSCTGSTSHGPYDPFQEKYGAFDFKLQNAMPSPFCLYSQGKTNPPSFFPPTGNCFGYFPDEWMTFQVHIKTGPRVNDEFVGSFVELWIAREGQPSQLAINWGPYNLSAGSAGKNEKFGKVWLLPYNTNKDPNAVYPVAYTWYDELIISTQRIPDPK